MSDVSVTILSLRRIDSSFSKCKSMEAMGTADDSTASSPVMASDKEHCVDILPVTRKPPIAKYYLFSKMVIY